MCPDCLHEPALCQTAQRDCHSLWHQPSFDTVRNLWFSKKTKSTSRTPGLDVSAITMPALQPPSTSRGRGRPRGAVNKRKISVHAHWGKRVNLGHKGT